MFGSSGIRSTVNIGLTPTLVANIGLAITTFANAKKVIVGRDTRVSGIMLENALISGLLAGGANVENTEIVPTPTLAFLTRESKAQAGVMITASHNSPQYNGIKIFNSDSSAYNEKEQNKIEKIISTKQFKLANWQNVGKTAIIDQKRLYIDTLLKKAKLYKNWQIIVDAGCGATHSLASLILKESGCKVTALNAQPDGYFPARSPEPNKDTLKSLVSFSRKLKADLSVAYDGDGDRVALIDEKGNFVDFDHALAAYAAHTARKDRGDLIVTTVEASMSIEKMVEAQNGKVLRTKVGDIYISEALKRHNGVFGGEPCGAWIHPQIHYCPDGILSTLMILKALEERDSTLSEFVAKVPQYQTLRKNVYCDDKTKHKVIAEISRRLVSVFPDYQELSVVDGVRLAIDSGWILIRASGTEPLIRLTAEGESLKAAKQIMKQSLRLVKKLVEEKRK